MAFMVRPAVVGDPGVVHTTQQNAIGAVAVDNLGNTYVYLKGVADTILGAFVSYDEAGVTALLDTDVADSLIGPVAVATGAVGAGKFGWYGRSGTFTGVAAAIADNAKVFPTSTAGSVDDVSVAGSQIVGAKARSGTASGVATFQINDPWIGVNVA